ncbi:MAG: class I SAM-dependent methyltransferase [SAR324 cluster bacterium]|nr:class I SAM-dependent methyltransferase [SAR324 cluster bacterium]
MQLNPWETLCMNNPARRVLLKHVEFQRFLRLITENQIDLKGAKILDLACGSGHSSLLLKKEFEPSLLVGFDLMPSQVELCKDKKQDLSFVGDLLQLPLKDNLFDAAFGFGLLHHCLDWKRAAKEIHRTLKVGGYLLIEEPEGDAASFFRKWAGFAIPKEGYFTFAEFRNYFRMIGFELVAQKTIWAAPFQAFCFRKM